MGGRGHQLEPVVALDQLPVPAHHRARGARAGAIAQHDGVASAAAGLRGACAGGEVGEGAALALSRVLASLVFDVPVRDPLTYLTVAAALALVALAACVIPARKASRVDPMVALRTE